MVDETHACILGTEIFRFWRKKRMYLRQDAEPFWDYLCKFWIRQPASIQGSSINMMHTEHVSKKYWSSVCVEYWIHSTTLRCQHNILSYVILNPVCDSEEKGLIYLFVVNPVQPETCYTHCMWCHRFTGHTANVCTWPTLGHLPGHYSASVTTGCCLKCLALHQTTLHQVRVWAQKGADVFGMLTSWPKSTVNWARVPASPPRHSFPSGSNYSTLIPHGDHGQGLFIPFLTTLPWLM